MRALLVTLGLVVVLALGGFGALVLMAEGMEPPAEEIRIDVSDQLQR